ncbi:MAG: glycosyltransferase [Phycisphaerales bacterium]
MITYIVPTRDRHAELGRTLAALGRLGAHDRRAPGHVPAEVVVVDNASWPAPAVPARLANGMTARLVALGDNRGAASRNAGAELSDPSSDWLVMLDDDSSPLDDGHVAVLGEQPEDVVAVSADIHLAGRGARESGGLPEVFIGCGVAIRRDAFTELGGYDASFGYYAEEYDLAARMLLAGGRVVFDPRFVVEHRKVEHGRDMNEILGRLVRNNGWVVQRYAPEAELERWMGETITRYRAIAEREGAVAGYERGLAELRATAGGQRRTPMDAGMWARFTGEAQARAALMAALDEAPFDAGRLIARGKNAGVIERVLESLGVEVREDAPVDVVGTLSPGPMIDALERARMGGRRTVAAWLGASSAAREPARATVA